MTSPENFLIDARAEPGSRLAQLLSIYDTYKDAADAAAAELKKITDAIKAEAQKHEAVPGYAYGRYELRAPSLRAPLTLVHSLRTSLDTAKLKQDFPEIEAQYGKTSEVWTLKRAGS